MMKRLICCCWGLLACTTVMAEVPVARSIPVDMSTGTSVAPAAQNEKLQLLEKRMQEQATQYAQTVIQMQQMMAELQQLRGLVEEQSHQIKLLKQQQQTLYRDLDGRLLTLQSTAEGVATPVVATPSTTPVVPTVTPQSTKPSTTPATKTVSADPAQEKARYKAATNLLKQDQYNKAQKAFQTYLDDYPQGQFAANAHYWLGQIYYINNELDKSEQSFQMVLAQFSSSSKVADSTLKLGDIYKDKQQLEKAKTFYQQVIKQYPGTSAARLANTKLQTM